MIDVAEGDRVRVLDHDAGLTATGEVSDQGTEWGREWVEIDRDGGRTVRVWDREGRTLELADEAS